MLSWTSQIYTVMIDRGKRPLKKNSVLECVRAGSNEWNDFGSLEQLKRLEKARADRRAEQQRQRMAPIREKLESYKSKEDQTLAMFRQMAEEQRKRGGLWKLTSNNFFHLLQAVSFNCKSCMSWPNFYPQKSFSFPRISVIWPHCSTLNTWFQ